MSKSYKRKRSSKRRSFKKRSYKASAKPRSLSRRILKLEKSIETKYIINVSNFGADQLFSNWSGSRTSGWTVPQCLNNCVRGLLDTANRVGSDIQMSTLRMRLNLVGLPHQEGAIRLVIFKMRTPNGEFPNIANPGGSIGNTFFPDAAPTVNAQYDTVTSDFPATFKVLYDRTHHLRGWGQSAVTDTNNTASWWANDGGRPSKYLSLKIALKCKATYENGNTGTYTDITRNSVYIMFGTDLVPDTNYAGAAIYPFVIGSYKLGFKDA